MSEIKCAGNETPDQLDRNFWDERWQTQETGWDLKSVSPPLKQYFDAMTCKNKSILIPGCGNAYEAEYLLQQGFKNITVIDISPTLTQQITERFKDNAGKELTIICGDFFKHTGSYDFIIEQTFFCALEKSRREDYVKKMHSLLKDTGVLAGLLFDKEFEASPPFGGSKEEYTGLFEPYFNIKQMEITPLSVTPRTNAELFTEMNKI